MDKITFHRLVDEGTVAKVDKPEEESVVHGPRQGGHRVEAVVCVLPLVHPLSADLDLGTDEVAVEELPVLDPVELSNLLARDRVVHLAGLLPTLLLEGHLTKMSDGCCELEGVVLLLGAEAEGVKGHISELQLLSIINGVNLDLSLRKAAKRVLGI